MSVAASAPASVSRESMSGCSGGEAGAPVTPPAEAPPAPGLDVAGAVAPPLGAGLADPLFLEASAAASRSLRASSALARISAAAEHGMGT